jgi:hypothetical protein
MFIKKIDFFADLQKMRDDLNELIKIKNWPDRQVIDGKIIPANQLGLTYRIGAKDPWIDASGSLYDKELNIVISKESDFSCWNDLPSEYTKDIIELLAEKEKTKFGRIRYMRSMPKTGLSIHSDFEKRYHYVLDTNPDALFGEKVDENEVVAKCYHIPADGYFYKVDTTKPHFVYNGGWSPRIHLVICEAI